MNNITKEQQKKANIVARRAGYQKATKIVFTGENKVISRTNGGYRKYTTGEYVSNAYRTKFGWKNTYYQHAETIVSI
jgi:hypothetical protein